MADEVKLCRVAGCDHTDIHARGLCHMHYMRDLRWGNPEVKVHPFPKFTRLCEHEGCLRKHYCRGLCVKHYSRMKARARGVKKLVVTRQCTYPGCTKKHKARGYCDNHYSMFMNEQGHHTLMTFLGLETWR